MSLEVGSLSQFVYKYFETDVKPEKISPNDYTEIRPGETITPNSVYLIIARVSSGSIQAIMLELSKFAAYETIYITEISKNKYYNSPYSRWETATTMPSQTVIVNPATWTYIKNKSDYKLDKQLSEIQMMATDASYNLQPIDAFGYIGRDTGADVLTSNTRYWIIALVAIVGVIVFGAIAYVIYDKLESKQPLEL